MIAPRNKRAFTLVELLVVISIIALLMSILMPALASARSGVRKLVCKSNVRQLLLANIAYATENDSHYAPAGKKMWNLTEDLYRWHGARKSKDEPFEAEHGPLAGYLKNGEIKECPEKVNFSDSDDWNTNFERGAGGYGYNITYVGSRLWQSEEESAYEKTARATEVTKPAQTVMFTDAAMSKDGSYIEYSFVWQPHMIYAGRVMPGMFMSPSIHFRHRGWANIGWADGHVGVRKMAETNNTNVYGVDSAAMNIGWLDPVDNTLFDLE